MSGGVRSSELERWGSSWEGSVRSAGNQQIAVAEIQALGHIDDVLPPELVDVPHHPCFGIGGPITEDLRLPLPPVRAPSGEALFRALTSFVAKLDANDRTAPAEQRRMTALLRGIHGLEVEIRSLIARSGRV
jgi:hypothetical protein